MKVSKWFNNTFEMIIYIIVFILLLLGFIYFGSKDYNTNKVADNEKFVNEHSSITIDNVYNYVNSNEVYNYIKEDNVIILFGIKNSEWVNKYASILNDVAKEVGIETIYYYDITEDRKNENGSYESIVEYLNNYVTYLDDDTKNIYVPAFFVKINGVVSLYDDETAIHKGNISVSDYWNNYNTNLLKEKLRVVLNDYMESMYE